LPALSWLAGHTPAQAARRRALPNTDMSVPISARMLAAVRSSTPGIWVSREHWFAKGGHSDGCYLSNGKAELSWNNRPSGPWYPSPERLSQPQVKESSKF
jgi:hypothetical protein